MLPMTYFFRASTHNLLINWDYGPLLLGTMGLSQSGIPFESAGSLIEGLAEADWLAGTPA